MYKCSALLVALALCLVGCAPLQVDLSHSEYKPTQASTTGPKRVQGITVINRAPAPEVQNKLFGTSMIPIKTAVPLATTVESDIKLLLAETLQVDGSADKSVLVTIRRVDAYWAMGEADKIPFVGLFTAGRDRKFVMHLVLSLEVRENGVIVASYPVDHQVTIVGKATTRADIAASYQRLIAKYRQEVLGGIQRNFIDKSL